MSPDPYQDILNTNGNNHHAKVVAKFRSLNWRTLVSPYYSDNITDKSREIDVIVERDFLLTDQFYDNLGPLRIRLFLECKYIVQETVLWFDEKDMERTYGLIDSLIGAETKRYKYQATNYLYGKAESVAKLFGSKKGNEENEVLSKAISQCLNAYIYYRHRTTSSSSTMDGVSASVSYPVIVCNSFDKFRRVDMSDASQKLELVTEPFQLEVNYAYLDGEKKPQNEFFLIDVITIDHIDNYLGRLKTTDVKEKISLIYRYADSDKHESEEINFDPYLNSL